MTQIEDPDIGVGTELAHYRIESPIGEGSMGVVYRAHDMGLDRPVALKVLKPGVSEDEEFVERFVREARAAARVTHPNLTHVYFVGEQDGRHFFAMEFVDGQDLDVLVRERGALDVDLVIDIGVQVAEGLQKAHAADVIHRDIKPSNILLQDDGRVRITDFGLAKSLDAEVSSTRVGQMIGTPLYMAPEQCRGRQVGRCTDIYALGLTLWTLLAGKPPYETKAIGELINDQINTPVPSLEAVRDDLPAGLDVAVRKLCAKDPTARPSDMAAVVRLLERFRGRKIQRAPLLTRVIAAVIDFAAIVAGATLLERLLWLLTGFHGLGGGVLANALASSLFAAYHLLGEARWGTTLGKWLLQTHVVSALGAPMPRRALLPRFALRYPAVLLSLVGLANLGDLSVLIVLGVQGLAVLLGSGWYIVTKGRTFSDRLTKTRVTIRPRDEDDVDDEDEECRASSPSVGRKPS